MFNVMASIIYYVCGHFDSFFPLITFVVSMMYLQIMQQRESLQMLK